MVYRNMLFVAAAVVVLGCLSTANAEMVQDNDLAYEAAYYPCSSTDLINLGQATLLSSERSSIDLLNWPSDLAVPEVMNNGSVSDDTPVWHTATYDEDTRVHLPVTYTFMLNTSENTAGYDITSVSTFTGFNQDNYYATLAQQKFELQMSKVGDDTWFTLGTYAHAPMGEVVKVPVSEFITLTDSTGGALAYGENTATNIDGVRFVFMDPEPAYVSYKDGTMFQELDVVGTASVVPEPSTIALLLSSVFGLIAYGWRKRN